MRGYPRKGVRCSVKGCTRNAAKGDPKCTIHGGVRREPPPPPPIDRRKLPR